MGIMPPHCDSLDGPVVAAAIETGSAEPVMDFLSDELKGQLGRRLDESPLAAGRDDLCRMPDATLRRSWDSRCSAIAFSGATGAGTSRAWRRSRCICRVGLRSVIAAAACVRLRALVAEPSSGERDEQADTQQVGG